MIQKLYRILRKRGLVRTRREFSVDWLGKRQNYYTVTRWKLNANVQSDVSIETYMRVYFKLKNKNEEALRGYILTHVESIL